MSDSPADQPQQREPDEIGNNLGYEGSHQFGARQGALTAPERQRGRAVGAGSGGGVTGRNGV